ncbi:MAG: ribosome maturation factor RimP [Holosporaceae bacterium]|jgi:ribosome maturation factor RimP|nr:ribosome maturation factor RimP [Holosporaceae bacterium]
MKERDLSLNARIIAATDAPLADRGYELVQLRIVSGPVTSVDIDIDRLDGAPVSVDDCVAASRIISAIFDVEDFINGKYNLNVSSPGEYRPIQKLDDFPRFYGREAKLELNSPINNRKKIVGKLLRIEQNSADTVVYLKVWCDTDGDEIAVPYRSIKKITVRRVF